MNDALLVEGKRQLDICNSCRYCEGYCAVFPALERRVDLTKADMVQLANLCHDCRECFYACMYAPPHDFGVNTPQLFSAIRREHADELSRFSVGLGRHEREPLRAGIVSTSIAFVVVLVIAAATVGLSGVWRAHTTAASPYGVIPYAAILIVGVASLGLGAALMLWQARRFWRSIGEPITVSIKEVMRALRAAVMLENLTGGGEGCAYPSEEGSQLRRLAHTAVAWGFASCLVATISAAVLQDVVGDKPPYGWFSPPVILGTVGGIGLVVGSAVLANLKRRVDPAPQDARSVPRELGLLAALVVLGIGGLATLLLRTTPAYGITLILHLSTVFACFVLAPFTKFMHGLYRALSLVRDTQEVAIEHDALYT